MNYAEAFFGALLKSGVQYIITGGFAVLCVIIGIQLRKKKNKKDNIEN